MIVCSDKNIHMKLIMIHAYAPIAVCTCTDLYSMIDTYDVVLCVHLFLPY